MGIEFVMQLLYGTALLTAIMAAPLVTLELDVVVNESDQHPTIAGYLRILFYVSVSLVLTAMALMPHLVISAGWRKRNSMKMFLAMLPWMLLCCIQFLINSMLQLKEIYNVASGRRQKDLVYALCFYCGLFGLALEQMLHWNVVYHLMTDGIITRISNVRLPLIVA
ncbi:uncharacterized protein LOC120450150 [Drosophila santomea]|uniref:uncharacterized protein LOC120450150 n=1 Tax=Drosophila santomea TaxID=129105 RepID=UPI001953906B|nr:uncharacterized protein LOC120450150 [Drosophila santomea]